MRAVFVLILVFLAFSLVGLVCADEEEGVNMGDIPERLSQRLNIPLEAANFLFTSMILGMFLFPALLLTRGRVSQNLVVGVVGLPILGFAILMGWTDFWLLLFMAMLMAIMLAGKVRGGAGEAEV